MNAERSDEALMLAYRDGDAQAFERLYRRHRGGIYRYLLRQCRNPADAEELFQDIWMNLIRARARYEPRARFTTYLYQLAHNRLIDHFRRRRPSDPGPEPAGEAEPPSWERLPAAEADGPERRAASARQAQRLLAALMSLPAEQRAAFLLREEAGLSLAEIAEATGVSAETAKSRLRYAVQKLRRALGASPDE
ncbi:MAG TPA: RNA polymerase sigma factor [Acidiferrobacterales bacterium]